MQYPQQFSPPPSVPYAYGLPFGEQHNIGAKVPRFGMAPYGDIKSLIQSLAMAGLGAIHKKNIANTRASIGVPTSSNSRASRISNNLSIA